MFELRKRFARRASVNRRPGQLNISIRRRNDGIGHLFSLLPVTVGFVLALSVFCQPFLRDQSLTGVLCLLLFAGLLTLGYLIWILIVLWAAFGTEEIMVSDGAFRWTRRLLRWKRDLQADQTEVTDVVARTPWGGFNNRVEITVKGRMYSVGNKLLRDEAIELAFNLRHALGTAGLNRSGDLLP